MLPELTPRPSRPKSRVVTEIVPLTIATLPDRSTDRPDRIDRPPPFASASVLSLASVTPPVVRSDRVASPDAPSAVGSSTVVPSASPVLTEPK